MRLHVTITNYPAGVTLSYPPLDWGKYGWIRWIYDGYKGETHWVNARQAVFEPEYRCPQSIECWFNPTVQGYLSFQAGTFADVPGVTIGGANMNPATGKGLPPTGII